MPPSEGLRKAYPAAREQLEGLEALVETALMVIDQSQRAYEGWRKLPIPAAADELALALSLPAPEQDGLALASDSATLIKAHSTKISLLIINEPFSPNAISQEVGDLMSGPLMGLLKANQACSGFWVTGTFQRELAWRSGTLQAALTELLRMIPTDGKALPKNKHQGFAATGKGSISTTGVLWAACDKLVKLSNDGVGGFLVNQMGGWKDILKDTLEELKEWSEEEPDDDEDEDAGTDEESTAEQIGNSNTSAQAMVDSIMNSHRTIPSGDPDNIRPRLESSLKRIRLVILLYQAVIKRRIKTLPEFPINPASNIPQRVDEVCSVLSKLPDRFGDLACAFYELNTVDIDKAMDQCFFDAFAASELVSKDWSDNRDEFSDWVEKFQAQIKKE